MVNIPTFDRYLPGCSGAGRRSKLGVLETPTYVLFLHFIIMAFVLLITRKLVLEVPTYVRKMSLLETPTYLTGDY